MREPRTLKADKARAFLRTVSELLPRADATVWLQRASTVLVVTASGNAPRRGSHAALTVWEPMPKVKNSLRARIAWVGPWPEYTTGVTDGLRQIYGELVRPGLLGYEATILTLEPAAPFSDVSSWEAGLSVRGGQPEEGQHSPVWATIQEWAGNNDAAAKKALARYEL